MNKIIHVVTDLNLSGQLYKAGSVIEQDATTLESLIQDGTLRVIEEAETVAQGLAIVAAEKEKAVEDAKSAEVVAESQNTWGPTAEPVVAPEAEVVVPAEGADPVVAADPVLKQYNVLTDFEVTDEASKNFGKHVAGETLEADPVAAQTLVDLGVLALVESNVDKVESNDPVDTGAGL